MAKPSLSLVEDVPADRCGEPTKSGRPCRRVTGGGPCSQHGDSGAETPPPPAHLGPEGRECWSHWMQELDEAGVLDKVDSTVVEKACEAYEAGRVAWKAVQKYGPLVMGRGDEVKKNPAVSKHLEYLREYRQYAKELGRLRASADGPSQPRGIGEWL